MDEMMKQYVEPLEVEVFHYNRKWLQKITALNMKPDRPPARSRRRDRWTFRPSWPSRCG